MSAIDSRSARPRVKNSHSLIIYLAHLLYWSGSYLCASNLIDPFLQHQYEKRGFGKTEAFWWADDSYNVMITFLLIAAWLAIGTAAVVDIVATVICLARIFELYMVVLRVIVSDSSPLFRVPVPVPVHSQQSAVRHILLVPIYLVQMTLVFAVLFQTLAHGHVINTVTGSPQPIEGAWTFLYLSWTTLSTLGSGFIFTSTSSRLIGMAEVVSGLAMIGVMLSAFIGSLGLVPRSEDK
jgi:hypothetical protein